MNITDALQLGTTSTTALAGNTTIPTAVSQLTNDSNFISNSIDIDKLTLVDTDADQQPGQVLIYIETVLVQQMVTILVEIDFRGNHLQT